VPASYQITPMLLIQSSLVVDRRKKTIM